VNHWQRHPLKSLHQAFSNTLIFSPLKRSSIMVFPSIDHFGTAYDGYQYSIYGSNDGSTWTALFDAMTVTGASEPSTLGTFTGTAPSIVNNVLAGGCTGGNCVGYEAEFDFSAAYQYYAFGASTEASSGGNTDQGSSCGRAEGEGQGSIGVRAALAFSGRGRRTGHADACTQLIPPAGGIAHKAHTDFL
jgi:hypothetical protein